MSLKTTPNIPPRILVPTQNDALGAGVDKASLQSEITTPPPALERIDTNIQNASIVVLQESGPKFRKNLKGQLSAVPEADFLPMLASSKWALSLAKEDFGVDFEGVPRGAETLEAVSKQIRELKQTEIKTARGVDSLDKQYLEEVGLRELKINMYLKRLIGPASFLTAVVGFEAVFGFAVFGPIEPVITILGAQYFLLMASLVAHLQYYIYRHTVGGWYPNRLLQMALKSNVKDDYLHLLFKGEKAYLEQKRQQEIEALTRFEAEVLKVFKSQKFLADDRVRPILRSMQK